MRIVLDISEEAYRVLRTLKEIEQTSWKDFFLLCVIRKLQDPKLYHARGWGDDISVEKAERFLEVLRKELGKKREKGDGV